MPDARVPRPADPVAPPHPASTVIVLRPTGADPSSPGFEVFVLRRVATMVFAPSMTVFPGGGVDPSDARPVPWSGPPPSWFATRLGLAGPGADDLAHRLVVAAVRELYEETGVLLAMPHPAAGDDPATPDRDPSPLARALADHSAALAAGALRPWAKWVTPPGGTRRYDTAFFVAARPDGVDLRSISTEADEGYWATPADLLAADGDGNVRLMHPTRAVLTDLARHATMAQVLAAEPEIVPVTRDAAGTVVRSAAPVAGPEGAR